MLCIPMKVNQRFGGKYRFYLRSLLHARFYHRLNLDPENGSDMFLRNIG
jgi:hypothetical protein